MKAALKFCEIHLKLISRTKRASFFFFSPETISKGDDIKIKRIVSPFFFPLPLYLAFTAVLSLFLARLHGLKAALKFCEIHLKLISRTKRASFFFFSPETISKGDDIKIKRIVSPFFFPLPLYLAFTAVLSLFLARLHGLKAALKFCEIHLKLISRTKRASFFFFSPETISKGDDIKIKRIVSPFFFPLPLYLAFTAVLSLFLARLHGLKAALKFCEIHLKLISRTKRASFFFFSPETISKGDDIKIKRIVSPFFFPLPLYLAFTAVLSLFLARLHGLKAALKFCEIHLKLISRTKRASFFFFSPETISKGDDIKIKRIVSPFFFPLPLYLAFTAVLSLFLARLHGLKAALKFCEIHLKLISRTKRASFFFFSPETISKGDDIKIKRTVSPFFFPLPLYLAFTAVLSLFLARFHGLEEALEFRELKAKKEF